MIEWEESYVTGFQANLTNVLNIDFSFSLNNEYAIMRVLESRIRRHNQVGDLNIFDGTDVMDNDPYYYSEQDCIELINRAGAIVKKSGGVEYGVNGDFSQTETIKRTDTLTGTSTKSDTGSVTAKNSHSEMAEESPVTNGLASINFPNQKQKGENSSTTERDLTSTDSDNRTTTVNDTHTIKGVNPAEANKAIEFLVSHKNILIETINDIVDKYYIEHLKVF